MANINYNDSSLISQLKLLVNQFLICHLICTHKSHVKSCFDSMHSFPVNFFSLHGLHRSTFLEYTCVATFGDD